MNNNDRLPNDGQGAAVQLMGKRAISEAVAEAAARFASCGSDRPLRVIGLATRGIPLAERLAAVPGTKAYGALSVRTQLIYEVAVVKIVPPQVFCPPPEVESALAAFTLRPAPLCDPDTADVTAWLVKLLFSQRRKQLGKLLGGIVGREAAAAALADAGFSPELRPDKLAVTEFVALTRAVMPFLERE